MYCGSGNMFEHVGALQDMYFIKSIRAQKDCFKPGFDTTYPIGKTRFFD
jgi:hypothetical protein